jgi:hypothetical protein
MQSLFYNGGTEDGHPAVVRGQTVAAWRNCKLSVHVIENAGPSNRLSLTVSGFLTHEATSHLLAPEGPTAEEESAAFGPLYSKPASWWF